jgi:hypothetical protein
VTPAVAISIEMAKPGGWLAAGALQVRAQRGPMAGSGVTCHPGDS